MICLQDCLNHTMGLQTYCFQKTMAFIVVVIVLSVGVEHISSASFYLASSLLYIINFTHEVSSCLELPFNCIQLK